MICKNCHTKNKDEGKVCIECNEPLYSQVMSDEDKKKLKDEENRRANIFMVAIKVLVPAIIIFALGFLYLNNK